MKSLTRGLVAAILLLGLAGASRGYEYPLQYTAPAGYHLGPVIGLQINADGSVNGSIYIYKQYCGRGGCGPVTSPTYLDGKWDAQGNLLTTGPGQAPTQPILSTNGTKQIYAQVGSTTTGHDTSGHGFGFVARPASHYTWNSYTYEYICGVYYCLDYVTVASGSSQVVSWAPPTTFLIQLVSDGDLPLNITSFSSQVSLQGYGTVGVGKVTNVVGAAVTNPGDGSIEAAPCGASVAPGQTCGLAVTFDPSGVTSPASTGYGYNMMTLAINSDAGNLPDWVGHFTIAGIPVQVGGDDN